METFMPCPAMGECVWTASPARKTREWAWKDVPTLWPIWRFKSVAGVDSGLGRMEIPDMRSTSRSIGSRARRGRLSSEQL